MSALCFKNTMKKYLLLCMAFLCGCAAKNTPEIPETTESSITETTQTTTAEIPTETTTRPKTNYLVYSVTENKVDLKLNKKVVQTLEFDYSPYREYISAEDFDFDGYTDIFIPSEKSAYYGTYYHYNPNTEQFEEWDELNKTGYLLEIQSDNTLLDTAYSHYGSTYTTYKWNGNILEPVTLRDCYFTYKDSIEDLYEYQPDGSKIIVERTFINPKNNARYKTLGREEIIYFEVTENSIDVMRDGKKLQSIESNLYSQVHENEPDSQPEDFIDIFDFDFDGYDDLYITTVISKNNYDMIYYHFKPETEKFEEWDELNNINSYIYTERTDNKQLRTSPGNEKHSEVIVYEWHDNNLVPVQREVSYTTDDGERYKDYFDSQDNIFRREQIKQYEFKKISVDDIDFDFDGYNDLYIPDYDELHGTYYRYNPDTEQFDEWYELNKIGLPMKIDDNRLKYHTSDLKGNAETVFYEWQDDKLIQSQRKVTYNTDDGERYTDYFNSADNIIRRERTIFSEYRITSGTEKISVDDVDFDFDGYNDLYIPDYDELHGTYYHYNPETENFDEWYELNKIGRPLTVGMSSNLSIGKILAQDTDNGQTFIYKWNGDKLNLVERCETDSDNNKIWYYIDENGNEVLRED